LSCLRAISSAPITGQLLASLSTLQLHAGGADSAMVPGSVATVKAFKHMRSQYICSAFPWCWTATSRKHDYMNVAIDDFTKEAPADLKNRIVASADDGRNTATLLRRVSFPGGG
jgi:hypothetical protein